MDSLLINSPFLVASPYAPSFAAGFAQGAAAGRCAGCGPAGFAPQSGMLPGLANTMVLQQLLGLLTGLLTGRQSAPLPPSTDAVNQSSASSADAVGQSSAASASGQTGSQSLPGGPIGSGSKVLMIGDSHSVGTFGTELDKQLRSAGAQVETYAASGSSANSWLNGGTTRSGWVARHQNGGVEQPPWNQPHNIPKLADLIAQHKPDVVIINLGANFRSDPSQARKLAEVCKRAGTRVIWVGPPKTREDSGDGGAKLRQFDESMKQALSGVGEYISSAQFTPSYAGGDGLHYNGAEGNRIASAWASGVARQLTGR